MYDVALTASAARVYQKLKALARAEQGGEGTSAASRTLAVVDDLLRSKIPENPHDPQRALHAPLTGLFRVERSNVRVIYWAPAVKRRPVCVVSISTKSRPRSPGRGPDLRLMKMHDAGYFRKVIEQLRRALPQP